MKKLIAVEKILNWRKTLKKIKVLRCVICNFPDPDPSIQKQKVKKNLDFHSTVTSK